MTKDETYTAISARRQVPEAIYEGQQIHCHCGRLALRWTSWSYDNPGMRFFSCPLFKSHNDCGFFEWHDGYIRGRARDVIRELIGSERQLARENRRLRKEIEGLKMGGSFADRDSSSFMESVYVGEAEGSSKRDDNWKFGKKCMAYMFMMVCIGLWMVMTTRNDISK